MSDHLISDGKRNPAPMLVFLNSVSLAALVAAAPLEASAQTVLPVPGGDAPGSGFLSAAQQGGNLDSGGSSDFAPGGGFLSALRGEGRDEYEEEDEIILASATLPAAETGEPVPGGTLVIRTDRRNDASNSPLGSENFVDFSLHGPFVLHTVPPWFALVRHPVREEQLDSKKATGINTVDFLAQGVALPTGTIDDFACMMQSDASWNPGFSKTFYLKRV